jgi:hypothetical protein
MMLGLPIDSFIVLFVVPALILTPMFYHCWKMRNER